MNSARSRRRLRWRIIGTLSQLRHSILSYTQVTWLRVGGAQIARDVRFWGRVTVAGSPEKLKIGSGAVVNAGVHLDLRAPITIGERCHISAGCHLHTGYLVRSDQGRIHDAAAIYLEPDVWLACSVVVGAGVTICSGATIGATAVVTRSIPVPGLYIGAPARLVTGGNTSQSARASTQNEPTP